MAGGTDLTPLEELQSRYVVIDNHQLKNPRNNRKFFIKQPIIPIFPQLPENHKSKGKRRQANIQVRISIKIIKPMNQITLPNRIN